MKGGDITEETTYYSNDIGVKITDTRAIFGSTTYAMSNITSVSKGYTPAYRAPGAWTIVLGIAIALICVALDAIIAGIIVGAILVGLGVWYLVVVKPTFSVRIVSASGASTALASKNERYIERIVQAMNEAIIKRG